MVRRFDIVMITDTRLPGGTSASVAEEIRAQAAAGYRTAVLQADSPLPGGPQPMASHLRASLERGEYELLLGNEPVEADLLLLRHPSVAGTIDPAAVPAIRARRRLLIADQAPGLPVEAPGLPVESEADAVQGRRYDPEAIASHLEAWLGDPVEWAPIGPLVRAEMAAVAPGLEQWAQDWVDVIDADAWRSDRRGPRGRIPVIGRHSRDHASKWPATRADVLRVYPARDDVEVRVLGGERHLRTLLGGRPPVNWVVHPFGSMPPRRFLAGIDVYAYYQHPAGGEPYGRGILEALASGAPTVLPPHFEALFEDAATYAEPGEALSRVLALHGDPAGYRASAERAMAFVAERFGHAVHLQRLAPLAEPTGTPRPPRRGRRALAPHPGYASEGAELDGVPDAVGRRRVLFVSSNGAGVGHLMRLMALAKHAPDDVEPLFLTFSQGAKVVDDAGYLVEYLASRSISGASATDWHPMLRERVNELIERYDVRAVVFDGTHPYRGLLEAAADQPGVGLVWSRRAMWKPGVSNPVLDLETGRFDLVLEPGEFAADEDRGATRVHRASAVRLGPVYYLGLEELWDRDAARAELGLDPDRPAALVNLGAGNINDVSSLLGMVVDRLAQESDLQVCVTRSIIADRATSLPDNVRTISVYPLARYLAAFDLAFAASGYNSFHELVLAGVPTVFVPNVETSADDQAARSRFAHRVGVGIDLPDPNPASIDAAVTRLMDPAIRQRMHERAVARRLGDGAPRGMEAITELVDRMAQGQAAGPLAGPLAASLTGAPAAMAAPPAVASDAPDPAGAAGGSTTPSDTGPAPDPAGAAGGSTTPSDTGPAPGPAVPSEPAVAAEPIPAPAPATSPTRDPAAVLRGLRRLLRRLVRRLLRLLRPVLAGADTQGPVRRVLVRSVQVMPAPLRTGVRRAVRVVDPDRAAERQVRVSTLPVPLGNVLDAATAPAARPVAIVLPLTADAATLAMLVDHTAQLQAASRSFAPLFITSDIDLRPFRRYGYLVEYLPPRDRWERIDGADAWIDARRQRLSTILQRFAITSVIALPEPGDDGVEGLLAMLSSVTGGPGTASHDLPTTVA